MKKLYNSLANTSEGGTMSMSESLFVPFYTLVKLCYTKAFEWSSLVPGPEAKSSLEIMNPILHIVFIIPLIA